MAMETPARDPAAAPAQTGDAPPSPRATTTAPDRRARRRAETRARLLAAARDLFIHQGYHATRPQDIARAADVAVGTFYTYFDDKRDAFIAFTRQVGDELMAELARSGRGPAEGFESALAGVLEALLDYSDTHPGVLGVAFGEAVIARSSGDVDAADTPQAASLRDRLAAALAEGLRTGMKAGRIHADYDADLVADAMVGLIHQGLVHGHALPRAQVISNITRFCARALVTDER